MQRTFVCPVCGANNAVGYRFCVGCGTNFQYKCLRCGNIVDPAFRFCPNCRTMLEFLEPQTPGAVPRGQNTYYRPQGNYGYGRGDLPQKKSQSTILYLGLILSIILIVVGVFLAFNPSCDQASPTSPVAYQPVETGHVFYP